MFDISADSGNERSEAHYAGIYEEADWSKINNVVKRSYSCVGSKLIFHQGSQLKKPVKLSGFFIGYF